MNSEAPSWHFPKPRMRAPSIMGPNATCVINTCHINHVVCGNDQEHNAASSNYTRVKFHVVRYGYGRGLKGAGIKLANVALLLHAALCLTFAGKYLWTGRSFSLANSMGEMIALAMNSSPTENLRGTCAGIKSLSTWEKIVSMQETSEEHLEFIFEDDGVMLDQVARAPSAGKRYG